jgi:hypothetical protein
MTLCLQPGKRLSRISPVLYALVGLSVEFRKNLSDMVGYCRILRLGIVLRYSEILEKIVGTCRVLSGIVG